MRTHSCDFCSRITLILEPHTRFFVEYTLLVEYPCEESQKSGALNVKYVREGSRNGCNFLQWICAGLTPEAMGGEIIEDERVVNVVKQPGHERSTLVLGNSKDGIVSFMVGDLYLIANADDPLAGSVTTRPIRQFCDTPKLYSLARQWISECMFNHRHVTDTELTHMPSRLVEIVSGESGDIVIRLNIEPSPDASYVALSYCWGHDQEYKTTSVNLDKQRHDISYLSLPKTLQDAINVMQKLGYKFIWIDSLCIIQDDEEDKNVEIARMPAVYSHAVVTIAASSAASVHEGFLNERGEASHANAVRVQVRDASQRTGRMILLWKVESEVGIEPLYDRGWALQERILSTRVLEFKSRQVRFHCSSSEAKPLADGWTFHPENHNSITPETIFTLIDLSNIGRVTWRKIVEVYSARKLGLSTDRPLAISGIAHKLARLDPHRFHTYVAGMWISELPFNLLWYCGDVEKCSRVPMQPSWSWTAINARVYMDAQVLEDPRIVQVEIISSHVELISELAPYGAVKNAELRIRGPLIRALCRRVANEPVGGIKIYDEDRNLVNPLCSPYLDAPECDFPTAEVEWPVCLLLVTQRVPDGPAYPMMGLILRLCGQTGERRWYSRVGMFISSCCSAGYAVAQLARMFAEVGEREQDIIELC